MHVIEDEMDECKSDCSDTECDGSMCNVNRALGHKKCFKHMTEQRGKPCDSSTPCHRCRTRLANDPSDKFRKHFLHCEKQRLQKQSSRNSKSIPVDTVVKVIPVNAFNTVACSLFAVTINTELLTTDEYETIVSIYNEAKQRHAVRTQQSSGSEQKLVRPVAKYFLCSAVVMRFPRSFFRIASWTRSRICKSVFQRWRRRGRPVPC